MLELQRMLLICNCEMLMCLFFLAWVDVQCHSSLPSRVVISNLIDFPMHAGFKLSKRVLLERRLNSRPVFEGTSIRLRGGGGCLSCFPRKQNTKQIDPYVQFALEAIFNSSESNGTEFTPGVLGSHEFLGSWMSNQVD